MSPETGATWSGDWPRPPRLLDRPELIETVALLPDHPPVSFTWRGVRRRVKRADGPERLFGEWWKRDAELVAVRDYFRVEDDVRSEEHTSELQSLMRISYAVFCLKKKINQIYKNTR